MWTFNRQTKSLLTCQMLKGRCHWPLHWASTSELLISTSLVSLTVAEVYKLSFTAWATAVAIFDMVASLILVENDDDIDDSGTADDSFSADVGVEPGRVR